MKSVMVVAGAICAIGLVACASSGKPSGRMEDVLEATAAVIAVDPVQRLITVKPEGGEPIDLEASESIKNLDQVKVGDEVALTYTEALAWQVRPAGQGGPGVSTGEEVATAPPGAKPSLTAKQSLKLTASITGPQGNSRTFKARDPGNLKKVKVGDLVDLVYTQAVALGVRPMKK
jgi:hypothetical protein